MAAYRFLTTFTLPAPRAAVFDAVVHPERWLAAWPQAEDVEVVDEGRDDGAGHHVEVTIRAPLGYRMRLELRTVAVRPSDRLELQAGGDAEGTGSWRLLADDGVTHGSLLWQVTTTKAWMNAVARVAKPLLAWNYRRSMADAIRGLAAHLGVEASYISGDRRGRQGGPTRPAPSVAP